MDPSATTLFNFQQLYSGIETTAKLAETPCNRDVFQPVIEVYKDQYTRGVVSLRTTSKPVGKRELDVRYIDTTDQPHDPYQMALDHDLFTEAGHPAESLMREIQQNCPIAGYGVDTSVSKGFTKIWTLFSETLPVDDMLALPSLPPAIKNYTDFFAKHGQKRISLVAIDFVSHVFNVYFMFRTPETNPPDLAANLIKDLEFNLPSEEEQTLFSHCGDVHFSFTWDEPTCERLSFVVLHTPEDQFPKHLHPMFPRLFAEFPTLRDQRYASIQSSYSKVRGDYLKIEMDYSGMGFAMRGAMDLAE